MQGRVFKGKGSAVARQRACVPMLAMLVAGLLAGCGGGASSSSSSSQTVPSSPAASTAGSSSNVNAVASIAHTPIAKSSYEHWLAVEKALGVTGSASHHALGFLISSDWVLGEAAGRGISVSEAEVKQRLAQTEHQSFPKAGALQKFLAKSGESQADLLARVKVELLESRIAAKVTAGKHGAQRKAVLASFARAFASHWKSFTTCKAGYVMEDCSQYKGKPENLSAGSSSSGSSAASAGSTAVRSSSSDGEVSSAPGSFAITSPAFGLNGAIPAQYTCDGANISPPLQWSKVPAKAAALVLFIIDESPTGTASGIRWVVGDINPNTRGVAAGKTPEGGIVGSDTQGHSGYGGICPAHGKSSTVEFVLYALSKKIALSPGFQADVAEREYGAGKLLLGSAAVTYAVYHRP
jgi:Raf kinase inhibitor-like YbhB/YbcL family protein